MADGDDVWVEVEVLKGTLVSVYRGRMAKSTFDAWRTGEVTRGALPLHDTYWSYDDGDGNEGWVVVGATPGPYARALGTTWIRADLLLVIVPLADGGERDLHRVRPIGGASRDDDF
jgi:hypothetical protein